VHRKIRFSGEFSEKMLTQFLSKLFPFLLIPAQPDCDWVQIIYSKMGGNVNSIPRDCCRMDGVRCNSDGHVTELIWVYQDLTGFIPPEIGNLANLQKLYCSIKDV
jgi:hypothetical protein